MKILLSDFIHNCLAMSLFLLRRVEDSFIVAGVAAWPSGVAQELSRLRDGSIVWELQGGAARGEHVKCAGRVILCLLGCDPEWKHARHSLAVCAGSEVWV